MTSHEASTRVREVVQDYLGTSSPFMLQRVERILDDAGAEVEDLERAARHIERVIGLFMSRAEAMQLVGRLRPILNECERLP